MHGCYLRVFTQLTHTEHTNCNINKLCFFFCSIDPPLLKLPVPQFTLPICCSFVSSPLHPSFPSLPLALTYLWTVSSAWSAWSKCPPLHPCCHCGNQVRPNKSGEPLRLCFLVLSVSGGPASAAPDILPCCFLRQLSDPSARERLRGLPAVSELFSPNRVRPAPCATPSALPASLSSVSLSLPSDCSLLLSPPPLLHPAHPASPPVLLWGAGNQGCNAWQ